MPKTKADVVAEAHRRIQVLSVDETASDDMVAYGGDTAESLLAELNAPPYSMAFAWTIDTVPEAAFRPFAWLLAVDMAAHYQVPAEGRFTALSRLRGYAFPDNRADTRDIDADGVISESEAEAGARAAFY